MLCSFIDTKINKYKIWENFLSDIRNLILNKTPDALKAFDDNLEDWLNKLEEKEMAVKKIRGQKYAIFKLGTWNFDDALKILNK